MPSLFVLLGGWAIYRSGFRNVAGPVVLIVVAGTIQLLALDLITGDTVASWRPLLVVFFGLSVLVGHWRRRRRVPSVAADDFDLIGVFGGVEDERPRRPADAEPRDGPDLIVTGFVVFGGISVT